ncbi:MAG TPA: hypothetical protein VEA99_20700, partial [Gemmatimonadaceae bacterium]|nr:hypothetical protein [Gemmatimonadaceae bacterium]
MIETGARGSIIERIASVADAQLRPFWLSGTLLVSITVYLAGIAWTWQHTSYDVWGALLIAPLAVAATAPIARRVAAEERDPTMMRFILGALTLKIVMSVVRYAIAFGYYGGAADSASYHEFGRELSHLLRAGELTTMGSELTSTGFIRIFTGVVYAFTGPTMIGGFVVFAWIGFWGLYFFYRAFRIAVPDGEHRRYARLVMLLPSALFWPSAIGKDAWMCLTLGLAAYGGAKVLRNLRGGFPIAALGIFGAAVVRPHVALLFFVAISVGYVLRRGKGGRMFGPLPKLVGVMVIVVAGVFLLGVVQEFFGVSDVEEGGATQALTIAQTRSEQGGSAFKAVPPTSPTRFAWAGLTVLFRPFPYEAGNVVGLLAALEGLGLLVVCFVRAPRMLRAFVNVRANPYPIFALAYTLL